MSDDAPLAPPTGGSAGGDLDVGSPGEPAGDERDARLAEGAAALASNRHPILQHPQLLLATAATLMLSGIVAIVVAWWGIARSTLVEEQLAYLVSGGVLGLALVIIGGLTFFSHWLTVLIRTGRDQAELLREVRDLEVARQADQARHLATAESRANGELVEEGGIDGGARGASPRRPVRRAPRRS